MQLKSPIEINKCAPGLSSLAHVHLGPIITAFTGGDADYSKLSQALNDELKTGIAELIFTEMLEKAVSHLPSKEREMIANAPVSNVFRKHFVELLKNTIDEFIKRNEADIEPTLTLSIDCPSENQVVMSLEDNGPGFSPRKLLEIADRKETPLTRGSEKYGTAKTATHAPLLGGAGKGLLLFISDIDQDKTLNLSIDNNPSTRGAKISVTGPLIPDNTISNRSTPLSEGYTTTDETETETDEGEEEVIMAPPPRRFGKRS